MTDRIRRFKQEAEAVHTIVHVVEPSGLASLVGSLTQGVDPERVVDATTNEGALTKDGLADRLLGLSEVEAAIAESGSIIVDLTKPDHLVSLLPQHHVAIVRASRIFETFGDWLRRGEQPSSWTQITGPSKTADIEKILVYGAHGPVGLTVIVVD